jgi:quinol monooxygenase YgiN
MTSTTSDEKMIELINVITVKPEYQQHIVDNVREFLKRIANEKPGFISARIYKSLDRSR